MKSVMVHQFSQVPEANVQRSVFDRNHGYKTTLDSGYLVPVFFDEVLPGDTKSLDTTFFGRLATPFVPVMDNIFLDYHLFFVPNRLVWDNFKKFMGERKNPSDSIDYLVPQIKSGTSGFSRGGLMDYFSIPPEVANLSVNALFPRAYNLIWNEWFRDENLQDSVVVNTDDTDDSESDYQLLKRGKRHDYFTSALPFPQKGPGVELPLGSTAPVYGNGQRAPFSFPGIDRDSLVHLQLTPDSGNGSSIRLIDSVTNNAVNHSNNSILYYPTKSLLESNGYDEANPPMFADLSQATAATINSIRQAIALQQFLERDARGGSRYTEIILSHFGVKSPDARLQRPEYLGGSSVRININPVAQTSSTDTTTPQGNLAGYGTVGSTGNGFVKSFTEHGVIIGLVSVRADLTYQQGIDRMFSRRTRYDYYWPTLAHLGEQEILNKEIYAQGTSSDDDIFGYQERYAEYRYKNSYITGKFRSSDPQSLDVWHLSQYFENLPVLNDEFIEENPPLERVLAVTNEPQLLLDCYFNYRDIRPMPVYGVPGLLRL